MSSSYRYCVAPMLDWSDRHCRYFHRLLSRHARLYTEMVTTPALRYGDVARHLAFDAAEHPLALQIGGSEPGECAHAARLAADWGYDEINLNCGCPSDRVQNGSFGACLMREPQRVADCVKAMRDATTLPVTVKHRIGLDNDNDYGFVRDFVGTVAAAGCTLFIVHARNAVLKGLSPKENRDIPPLRYEVAYQLQRDFPQLDFVLNGGLNDWTTLIDVSERLAGVMVGRWAYHHPYHLAEVDQRLFGQTRPPISRAEVIDALIPYFERQIKAGVPLRLMTRHILGLYAGCPGGRLFRQYLSTATNLARNSVEVVREALRVSGIRDQGSGIRNQNIDSMKLTAHHATMYLIEAIRKTQIPQI